MIKLDMTVKEFLKDMDFKEGAALTADGIKLRTIYHGDLSFTQVAPLTEGDIWRVGKHIYHLRITGSIGPGFIQLTEGES